MSRVDRKLEQRRAAFLQGGRVSRFVVGLSVYPAAIQNTNRFKGQGSNSGSAGSSFGLWARVEGTGPERAWDGLPDPLTNVGCRDAVQDERRWTQFVATAFRHGCDASVALGRFGGWKAFSALSEGHEQAGRENGACTTRGAKERVIGKPFAAPANLGIEVCDGVLDGAKLKD